MHQCLAVAVLCFCAGASTSTSLWCVTIHHADAHAFIHASGYICGLVAGASTSRLLYCVTIHPADVHAPTHSSVCVCVCGLVAGASTIRIPCCGGHCKLSTRRAMVCYTVPMQHGALSCRTKSATSSTLHRDNLYHLLDPTRGGGGACAVA